MNNSRVIESLIAFVVLVAAMVGIWHFGFNKSQTQNPTLPPQNPHPPPPQYPTGETPTETPTTGNKPQGGSKAEVKLDEKKQLKIGSKGEEVKALQTLLNKIVAKKNQQQGTSDYWGSVIFGNTGSSNTTATPIQALTVDGSFGKKTDENIGKYLNPIRGYVTLGLARMWAKNLYSIE